WRSFVDQPSPYYRRRAVERNSILQDVVHFSGSFSDGLARAGMACGGARGYTGLGEVCKTRRDRRMAGSKRIVIFTGGNLGDDSARHIRPGDLLIGADSGALRLIELGFEPDLAIGDFDSVTPEAL